MFKINGQYSDTKGLVDDLEANGHLIRIKEEVDPYLEMAFVHRKVSDQKGPALLFENVKGSRYPALSNIYGTEERVQFIFRDTWNSLKNLMNLKAKPKPSIANLAKALSVTPHLAHGIPIRLPFEKCDFSEIQLSDMPQLVCWPEDGGAYITLGQVFTESINSPGWFKSNLGMYRVQISSQHHMPNEELGLHYQIHRGIGVHHHEALEKGEELKVSIFLGGPPAHAFSAVMPLPEGLPEVAFAGILGNRNFRYTKWRGWTLSADADFNIIGTLSKKVLKPEGPFGDHLGYYSLAHDFPVLKVEKVFARDNAIWPFTVVGRPPQEDSVFGALIHDLTEPMVPASLPGVKEVHAVDEAGVHPLLLAIGSERYVPYQKRKPQELLTQANAILGFGQMSLAKYLMIASYEDDASLSAQNVEKFFAHCLERVDWRLDIHFQTKTTIDTLDYSGEGLNQGSKAVIAVAGDAKRKLAAEIPAAFKKASLPDGIKNANLVMPGIMAYEAPPYKNKEQGQMDIASFCKTLSNSEELVDLNSHGIVLIIICDDSNFLSDHIHNFLWQVFTRSNPASDIDGIKAFTEDKHWGCHGPLIIDARAKPHHAPELIEPRETIESIKRFFTQGASLDAYEI